MIKSGLMFQYFAHFSFPSYLTRCSSSDGLTPFFMIFFFCLKHPFSPFPCIHSYWSSETHSKQDFHKQPLPNPWAEVHGLHTPISWQHCVEAWQGTYHTIISDSPCLGLPPHGEPLQEMSSLLLDPWHLQQGLTGGLTDGITDLAMDTTWPPLR